MPRTLEGILRQPTGKTDETTSIDRTANTPERSAGLRQLLFPYVAVIVGRAVQNADLGIPFHQAIREAAQAKARHPAQQALEDQSLDPAAFSQETARELCDAIVRAVQTGCETVEVSPRRRTNAANQDE